MARLGSSIGIGRAKGGVISFPFLSIGFIARSDLLPVIAVSFMMDVFGPPPSKAGMKIWDINEFQLSPVPQQDYGIFYQGACMLLDE